MPRRPTLLALAAVLVAVPALAQTGYNRYEMQYGTPVDVTITDLVQNSAAYEQRAVRTKGRLELAAGTRTYVLRDVFGSSVLIIPASEIEMQFEQEALTFMGQELQVTGVFQGGSQGGSLAQPLSRIGFWEYVGPERETKGPIKATTVTLEALVSRPGKRDGQTVRVVGKFRGRNLYGDLPVRSQKDRSDWVIKDDLYAIWVTGKKPKGSGWELDAALKRDTGKWIEVVGRPETRGGVTYVRAMQVNLTTPPTPTADAQPPPPPPERPKLPPVVVFALPLDGDGEVPADSRFTVQFSKDMDEQSFKNHVLIRYAGPRRPGDREFDGMKLRYDGGRRALTVDPGDVLRPGRQLELLLLPGIADVDGLALVPRGGSEAEGAVDVLRFRTGT